MTNNKKTILNAFFSGTYQILILIVPLITTPYITRIFTPKQLGEFGTSIALAGFFVVLGAIGTPYYGSREVARANGEKKTLTTIFFKIWSYQIILTIVSFILYILCVVIFVEKQNKLVYILQSSLILANMFDISWFFVGLEEIKKTIMRNVLSKLFIVITIFLFIKKPQDLNKYILLNSSGIFLGNLFMMIELSKRITVNELKKVKFKYNSQQLKAQLKLMMTQLFNNLKLMGDKPVLQLVSNNYYTVGIYDQGKKIITIINQVSTAVSTAVMPKMTIVYAEKNIKLFNKVIYMSFVLFNSFSIILIPGTYAVSQTFVNMFFGVGFSDVEQVLLICSWSLIFLPVNSFIANAVLLPLGRDNKYLKIRVMSSILMLILTSILGFKFLFIGASIAFLVTEIFMFICFLIIIKDIIEIKKIVKDTLLTFLVCIIQIIIFNFLFIEIEFSKIITEFLVKGLLSVLISLVIVVLYLKKMGLIYEFITRKNIRDIFGSKKNL